MSSGPGHAGRLGLVAVGASVACTLAVAVAGPSAMEPALPGRAGPPWSLGLHLSPYLAVGLTAAGLAAGTAGLVLVLRAARGGWSVPPRAILAAGLLAAAALTLVPPSGSSDHLSYAAYGRMLVTGHDPYTTTPAQLAALGDPVARAVQDWPGSPSVYGPLATAIQALASLAGGTSVRLIVSVLGLANLAAFTVTALLLHRMTRRDPASQLRAALLWAANPLLLQVLVAGAHVDTQAVAFGVAAVCVLAGRAALRPGGLPPPGPRRPPRFLEGLHPARPARSSWSSWPAEHGEVFRAALAGVLAGLGFAVKVTAALAGLGLAIVLAGRLGRRPRRPVPPLAACGPLAARGGLAACGPLAAFGAGFAVTAGATVAIGGAAMLRASSRASDMVSIGSPWRVVRTIVHLAVAGTAATDIVKFGAVALAVALAVLIIRGLPARPAPAVAFAVVLAWLFAWPYVLPWYDALAWALLPLVPLASAPAIETVGWLLLARTAALGFGYLPARQAGAPLPPGLGWLQSVVRHGVTPAVLAVTTVWLVAAMLRSSRLGRPGSPGPGGTSLAAGDAPIGEQVPAGRKPAREAAR
ncbi:MAG: polyprenol phosphomannose-dependent alpha 1,6 mannosyltransferase MptB [Actinobacteria bacterium]|nr:polyprenol phosphomannose-dependent alpha 1,6 mannosyltransferase MptB [Actinomycetota bacterium]